MKELTKINNEIKSYINQAKFLSQKHRNKLVKMLGEEFSIDLPIENFANIDVQITKEGSLIMRGDEYKSPNSLSEEEIIIRYEKFKEKAENMINKKEVNYYNKKDINNILNIFIVAILSLLYLVIIYFAIRAILNLNFFTFSILSMILSSRLVPSIRNRFEQAKNFLRRKLKKNKKS